MLLQHLLCPFSKFHLMKVLRTTSSKHIRVGKKISVIGDPAERQQGNYLKNNNRNGEKDYLYCI